MPLVKLQSATASIIHLKALPPGTPRRVRAIWAAQIDSPVDANSAAACAVVGQDTEAQLSVMSPTECPLMRCSGRDRCHLISGRLKDAVGEGRPEAAFGVSGPWVSVRQPSAR